MPLHCKSVRPCNLCATLGPNTRGEGAVTTSCWTLLLLVLTTSIPCLSSFPTEQLWGNRGTCRPEIPTHRSLTTHISLTTTHINQLYNFVFSPFRGKKCRQRKKKDTPVSRCTGECLQGKPIGICCIQRKRTGTSPTIHVSSGPNT